MFRDFLLTAAVVLSLPLAVAGASINPLLPKFPIVENTRKRSIPSSHVLHERHQPHIAHSWSKRSKVPAKRILPVRIGLKQSNLEEGKEKLLDISTPGSPNYGKHMSAEEVIEFFAPQVSVSKAVLKWLEAEGFIAGVSVNKQWVQFDATTAKVEELLAAEFFVWEHTSGTHDISSEEYHVPMHIQEHIDYITPGVRLRQSDFREVVPIKEMNERKRTITPDAFPKPNISTCYAIVTTECTRIQYDIPNSTTAAPGNELGIFEGAGNYYSKLELDEFFSSIYPYIPNGTYPEERLIDGAPGAIEDNPGFKIIEYEAPIDLDTAWPLIWPQKIVLFQQDDQWYEEVGETGTGDIYGFWNTFLDAIDGSYCNFSAYGETGDCTVPDCLDPVYPDPNPGGYNGTRQCGVYEPTNVISISFSGYESDFADFYIQRQCLEWMKLGLQGTTVVVSSGDYGVGQEPCNGTSEKIFRPKYPSVCPWVLSVGSTELDYFSNTSAPVPGQKLKEVATQSFPSGGGFSNVFPRQDFQNRWVETYFEEVGDDLGFYGYEQFVPDGNFSLVEGTGGVFNKLGRAYPDVAAVGDRQLIHTRGQWALFKGTSVSAPIWGAIITLVNEARIAAGKSVVGFIHPVLYAHPEVFNDITSGSNPGCNSSGFLANKHWDPVSGLGSPHFPRLLDVFLGI